MIVSDDGFAGEPPPAAPPPPWRDAQCSPENPLLAAALAYAARGWLVLPCVPDGKRPLASLAPNGVKNATTDLAIISAWWAAEPQANVAIATGKASGIAVLDVDGDEGLDSLGELLSRSGGTVRTPTAATGGGGCHLFYLTSGAGITRNSVRKLGPGLDVRGEGGYVVAPPSRHESGRLYLWIRRPHQWPLAPAPAWLEGLSQQTAPSRGRSREPQPLGLLGGEMTSYARRALQAELERLSTAPNGTRNDTLNRAAFACGQLAAGGELDLSVATGALVTTARAIGLEPTEIARTVLSGVQAGLAEPRRGPRGARS